MIRHLSAFILIAAVFSTAGCRSAKKDNEDSPEKNRAAMMKADTDFSELSEAKGMKNAFLEFIDSNGVLLRPDTLPIIGADAVDYLIAQNDTAYSLIWKPTGGKIAESGELGYTYGVYELHPHAKDTLLYGTYVSIWKKQADGKWKFVLSSGNEGVGE